MSVSLGDVMIDSWASAADGYWSDDDDDDDDVQWFNVHLKAD